MLLPTPQALKGHVINVKSEREASGGKDEGKGKRRDEGNEGKDSEGKNKLRKTKAERGGRVHT